MKKIVIMAFLCGLFLQLQAQNIDLEKKAAEIQAEADVIYKSEWTSWLGSDIFSANYKNKQVKAGGYISYDNGKNLVNVFYSTDSIPVTLGITTFEYGFNPNKYQFDTVSRKLNQQETDLYLIRKTAIKAINTDTIFKMFNNAELNTVPVINKQSKKVYVLTGPKVSGVVLFGNDYELTFNKKNEIVSTVKLHNSLIPTNISKDTTAAKMEVAGMHNHIKGKDEFITATDICTLRLYQGFTTWNNYMIISAKYVSVWNCKTNQLRIMTDEAWKKISVAETVLKPQ